MAFAAGDQIIALHTSRQQIPLIGILEGIDNSTGVTLYSVVLYDPQGNPIATQVTAGRIWEKSDGSAPAPVLPIVGAGNHTSAATVITGTLRPEI